MAAEIKLETKNKMEEQVHEHLHDGHTHETVEQKKEIKQKEDTEKKIEDSHVSDEKKKKVIQKKSEKTVAVVNADNLPISTKVSTEICRFIKGKKIQTAILELEQVTKLRRAIPMRGEYAHRRGKMMGGKYPKNASEHFIIILKSLSSNASSLNIHEPIITKASPSIGSRPYGRFGAVRHKRTHVILEAKSMENKKEDSKSSGFQKEKENKEKKKIN
jgi:ribosomal protein L22